MSAPTWNEEFELPNGSYAMSDIQYYFEYLIQNMIHSVKQKIESRLKLKQDIISNF